LEEQATLVPIPYSGVVLLLVAQFGIAFGISAALTPLVARWARAHGIVAQPRQDRWHRQPTAMLGGVAIYVASTAVILAFAQRDTRLLGLVGGGTLLFLTGLIDDFRHLRPHTKLIAQILAGCVLIFSGVQIGTPWIALLSIPLTILWVVGITNAFNLLDNMDGLSAGTALIASLFMTAFAVEVGNLGLAGLCLCVGGAALGFLIYNVNPARIFMGDSGSMYLGFTLSGITLLGSREMASDIFFVLLIPAAIMGLPIFDTALVTVVRTLEGRPLSQGGRDHLSHRLVAVGLSERQSVLVLYVLAAAFGSLGIVARMAGAWLSLLLAGVYIVIAVLLGAFLAQVRIVNPVQYAAQSDTLANRPVVNGMIMFKRELGEAALDFVLVCVAYLGAFVLHYGFPNPAAPGPDPYAALPTMLSASLAFVVVVKMTLLLAFQAYRGMWRYIGVTDLMNLAKITIVGSIILFVLVPVAANALRGVIIPRSVLVIDFLLFTFLLIGSRLSFAALNEAFVRLQSRWQPRVLIIGAGDLGELVVRSVLRARPAAYRAVGFLDPDPATKNRTVHNVRVLGTTADLVDVVNQHDIDLVVLALAPGYADLAERIKAHCESLGLAVLAAATFVEMHFAGLPVLPAHDVPSALGLADPGGSPKH
jgi:UDP-GlcNAc:undecaprenyl-phosphate/decaprenyl-phosphate GlcNAc-1-phosphate transferase